MSAAEDQVLQSLAAYGAPLAAFEPNASLPLEEALAEGIKLARTNASVFKMLPMVVLKHLEELDWAKLKRKVRLLDESMALEPLVDLTTRVSDESALGAKVDDLRPAYAPRSLQYFWDPKTNYAREVAERKTPDIARQWGFHLNTTEESLRMMVDKDLGSP